MGQPYISRDPPHVTILAVDHVTFPHIDDRRMFQ